MQPAGGPGSAAGRGQGQCRHPSAGTRWPRARAVAATTPARIVAALLEKKFVPTGPTVAVLSGGNIEWDGLCGILGDR